MSYELYHFDHPEQAMLVEADNDEQAAERGMDYLSSTDAEHGCWRLSKRIYDDEKGIAVDGHGQFYHEPVREYRVCHEIGYVASHAPGEIPDVAA